MGKTNSSNGQSVQEVGRSLTLELQELGTALEKDGVIIVSKEKSKETAKDGPFKFELKGSASTKEGAKVEVVVTWTPGA